MNMHILLCIYLEKGPFSHLIPEQLRACFESAW